MKEKRSEVRDTRFRDDVTCELVPTDRDEIIIQVRPLDVSRRGLGFISEEPLNAGGFFWLVIADARFRVELAYCSHHRGHADRFRCGLFLREPNGDLKGHCVATGLMASSADGGGSAP